jgi:hypothetical protein
LAELRFLAEEPGQNVGSPACRKGDNQSNGFDWVGHGRCALKAREAEEQGAGQGVNEEGFHKKSPFTPL